MNVTQRLVRVLSDLADFNVRAYSGRFMFGKECLAVSCRCHTDLIMLLAEEDPELLKTLGKPTLDDLGKGVICYWPQVAAPDEDSEEDQE